MNASAYLFEQNHAKKSRDFFPRMKVSFSGRVVDHNDAAGKLLHEWHYDDSCILPKAVTHQLEVNMYKLKNNDSVDVYFPLNGTLIPFLIVPFLEAGYFGLYGSVAI